MTAFLNGLGTVAGVVFAYTEPYPTHFGFAFFSAIFGTLLPFVSGSAAHCANLHLSQLQFQQNHDMTYRLLDAASHGAAAASANGDHPGGTSPLTDSESTPLVVRLGSSTWQSTSSRTGQRLGARVTSSSTAVNSVYHDADSDAAAAGLSAGRQVSARRIASSASGPYSFDCAVVSQSPRSTSESNSESRLRPPMAPRVVPAAGALAAAVLMPLAVPAPLAGPVAADVETPGPSLHARVQSPGPVSRPGAQLERGVDSAVPEALPVLHYADARMESDSSMFAPMG